VSTVGSRRFLEYDVLAVTALLWFLGKFVRYAFPPLFSPLQSAYGVQNTALGTAFTGFMLVYALMQFPSGVIADRVGPVRVIALGAGVAGGGALALAFDAPFLFLAGVMLLIGAGTGAHKTVAVRLLARTYPTRTGRVLGAHDTAGALGGVAAPAAVALVLAPPAPLASFLTRLPGTAWRGVFALTGVLFVVSAVGFLSYAPGRLASAEMADRLTTGDGASVRAYLAAFRDPRLGGFVFVTVAFSVAYNGAVAFLPLFFTQAVGLAASTASLLYASLFAVTFVQLVSGDLSDRFGRFPVMVIALALAALALVILVVSESTNPVALGAVTVAFGLGSHGFRPVRGAYLI